MINNVLFRWYAALLRERFGGDEDVLSEIDIAEAMHGVSLGSLIREDSKLALKLRDAFRAVALEITRGQHTFPETDIDAKQVIQSFEELVRILDRLKV